MKKKLLLSFIILVFIFFKLNAQTWGGLSTGTNGTVNSLAILNGDLYAGGKFTMAGSSSVMNIAKWNIATSTWSALGGGLGTAASTVKALAVYNGVLYAAGDFTTPTTRIAKWNPVSSTWTSVGSGVDNTVWALTVFNDTLFVGGDFLTVNGSPAHYIAKWDGASWSLPGGSNGTGTVHVYCFAIHNSQLYAGGNQNYIVKWSPGSWTTITNSSFTSGNYVQSMASFQGSLYVSGNFTQGTSLGIAKYNGSWSSVGTTGFSISGLAWALTSFNGALYAGGTFTSVDGNSAFQRMAKWTGSAWQSAVANGPVNGDVYAFATTSAPNLSIYAGGGFTNATYLHVMQFTSLVGIEEQSLSEGSVSIYPNPSHGNVFIKINSEIKNPQVEIFNMMGERIYSEILSSKQVTINTQGFSSGIYFVKISSLLENKNEGVQVFTQKLMIE